MDLREGIVKGFDAAAYRAQVQLVGSLGVWLEGVAVARNIPAAEMVIGRRCAVVFFEPANPQNAVLIAVYV